MTKAQMDLVNLIDKEETKEVIEFKKNLIEKNVDLDENTVKYDDEYKAFMVAKIIPTSEFFHHRLDNTDKAIENLAIRTDKAIEYLSDRTDKALEAHSIRTDNALEAHSIKTDNALEAHSIRTDKAIDTLRCDMDKQFERTDKAIERLDISVNNLADRTDKKFDILYDVLEKRDS